MICELFKFQSQIYSYSSLNVVNISLNWLNDFRDTKKKINTFNSLYLTRNAINNFLRMQFVVLIKIFADTQNFAPYDYDLIKNDNFMFITHLVVIYIIYA